MLIIFIHLCLCFKKNLFPDILFGSWYLFNNKHLFINKKELSTRQDNPWLFPEAPIFVYLSFAPLIFHITLNKITLIMGPKFLSGRKTIFTPLSHWARPQFFNLLIVGKLISYYFMMSLILFLYLLYWYEPGNNLLSPIR